MKTPAKILPLFMALPLFDVFASPGDRRSANDPRDGEVKDVILCAEIYKLEDKRTINGRTLPGLRNAFHPKV